MKFTVRRKRKLMFKVALGFAVAAVAAPTALARPMGMSPQQWADLQEERALQAQSSGVSAVEREGIRELINARATAAEPRVYGERARDGYIVEQLPRTYGERAVDGFIPDVAPVVVSAKTPDSGFEWGDVALGTAALSAFVALLCAALLSVRHARRRVVL